MRASAVIVVAVCGCVALPGHPSPTWADTSAHAQLVMRTSKEPYRAGPRDSAWTGRAVLDRARLAIDFPLIAVDNVGCDAVDSLPRPVRRYYWMATATYPGSRYPHNHFRSIRLEFDLPPEVLPTAQRLDSAVVATALVDDEVAGEPPTAIRSAPVKSRSVYLRRASIRGQSAWHVHFEITDASVLSRLRSIGVDSVSLHWCQRDQWLTYLAVPLERR